MNEREQFIDRNIMEILYDNVNSPYQWDKVCKFVQTQPDLEWGRDILSSIQRLGFLGRYYYELKQKVNALELEEVWEDFRKSNLERNETEYLTIERKREYNELNIQKKDDNEETWKKLKDYNAVSFIHLKTVDIQQLIAYPQLERIDFSRVSEVKNLHLLEEMPNLRKLYFNDIKKCTSDKEKISLDLEVFHCSNPKITRYIIHNSGMKFLWLDHMDTILDLQTIGSLETLELLFLDRITKVVHPEALIRAKNLRELRLFVIRPGDDWSVIKELPLLHTLEFNAEPSLKESLCKIVLSHPWVRVDPNFGKLEITTLNYLETIQNINIYQRVSDKVTTYCVFGDFSDRMQSKSNTDLESLVKQRLKEQKVKTKYLYDCEVGMFSVDAPTIEDAHQLIELLSELLD